MQHILDKLIGYIAPHECLACGTEGAPLCSHCLPLLPEMVPQCYRCNRTNKNSATCKACKSQTPLRAVWIRTNYEGFAEQLLRNLKFQRSFQVADVIARSLTDNFTLPQSAVIVPVPTATSRIRQRGYNQSVLVAKAFAKQAGLPCHQILRRQGQFRQTNSSRADRIKQMEHAFTIHKHLPTKDTNEYILLDDVLTTGATLEAAAKTLKHNGAKKVSAIVFARA